MHHCGGIEVCVDSSSRKGIYIHISFAFSQKKSHKPQVTYKEIDEMIKTVDKNNDGKINYSEFRVRSSDLMDIKAS